MAQIKIVWPENVSPKCPHCEKDLTQIYAERDGGVDLHTVYFCPFCKKVLGIGNDRVG